MALPAGVQTCVVTFSPPMSFTGGDGTVSVVITPTHSLVWAATGQPILDFDLKAAGTVAAPVQVSVPHVDQAGFLDQSGNAFTGWAYTAKITWKSSDGQTRTQSKAFQVVTGQTLVDVDTLPGGAITTPVSAPIPAVTSVGGFTDAVTVEQLEGLGLGGGSGVASWTEIEALPDTPDLVIDTDPRLADQRVPTDGSVVLAKLSTALQASIAKADASLNQTEVDARAQVAIAALVGAAPASLNTLSELADALADDASFAATMTAALAGKVPTTRTVAGKALSANVTLARADVGLGNVDNTSDAAKPVSTATQAALDVKMKYVAIGGVTLSGRFVAAPDGATYTGGADKQTGDIVATLAP